MSSPVLSPLDAPHLDIASPTEARGLASLGLLGMPSEAISVVSLVLLPLTVFLLQRNALQRELLRLDLPVAGLDGWPLFASALALALSVLVAFRGARRPGPVWPRVWAAILPVLSLLGIMAAVVAPATPLIHACAAGLVISALTLSARLLTLGPDSKWLRRIVPMLLVGLLSVGGSLSMAFQTIAMSSVELGIEDGIQRLQSATTATRSFATVDWTDFTSLSGGQGAGAVADASTGSIQSSGGSLGQISAAHTEFSTGFAELLRQAVVLDEIDHGGRGQRLTEAYGELIGALRGSLQQSTRLGRFPEPAPLARQEGWSEEMGQVVVGRRAFNVWGALGDLITRIEPSSEPAALSAAWTKLQAERTRIAEATRHTLTERWQAEALTPNATSSPLRDVLEARLEPTDSLPPVGAFSELLDLSFSGAMSLVGPTAGCRAQGFPLEAVRGSRSRPGGYMHFVECFGRGSGGQADLMVRLVYVEKRAQAVPPSTLPTEIYTLFIVPGGTDTNAYRDQVANAIAETARSRSTQVSLPDGRSRLLPRFTITTQSRRAQICSDSDRDADTATFRETARTGVVFRVVPEESGC